MGWAVTLEGRSDPRAIVLLIEDRAEAESIAREIRNRGPRVVVVPYPEVGPATLGFKSSRWESSDPEPGERLGRA